MQQQTQSASAAYRVCQKEEKRRTVGEVTSESEALIVRETVLAIEGVSGCASDGRVGRADRGTDSERVAARFADVTDRES